MHHIINSLDTSIKELGLNKHISQRLITNGYTTIRSICAKTKEELISSFDNTYFVERLLVMLHSKNFMLDSEAEYYQTLHNQMQNGKKIDIMNFNLSSNNQYLLKRHFGNLDKLLFLTEDGFKKMSDKLFDKQAQNEIVFFIKYMGFNFSNSPAPKAKLETSLHYFYPMISEKTYKLLRKNGIQTLENLLNVSKNDLEKIDGFGIVSINETILLVECLGYNLKEPIEKKEEAMIKSIEKKMPLETSIRNFSSSFQPYVYNKLYAFGIRTLEDLIMLTPLDLLIDLRFGQKTVKRIGDFVNLLGYNLGYKNTNEESLQDLNPNLFPLNTPLEQFQLLLSLRTYNCLRRANIETLEDLLSMSVDELLKIENFGPILLKEVVNFIHSLGYKIKDEIELDLENKINIQIQENSQITNRIARKEQLLNRYNELINERESLIKTEKELDRQISNSLQILKDLGYLDEQKIK